MKTYLKNKRAYARKRGYLSESTNQKQSRHDDDDDEEEEEDVGHDEEKEKEDADHDDEDEEEQEKKEDGWNRGNGWGVDPNEDADDFYMEDEEV